ncbi:MAG: hypothetical protein EOO15_16170 [Chitinophagaceae bacterium]|nr:MAG: hypothetical protein EOO15_16170 [Chitinophagaceae bacterium]
MDRYKTLHLWMLIPMLVMRRKRWESHAWWLIASVFIIMMPALGRGVQNVYVGLHRKEWPHIDIMAPIYLANVLIIVMILAAAWKWKKLRHSATWLAVGVNLFNLMLEPLGRSPWVQETLKTIVKG